MSLSPDDIRHVARLARLELADAAVPAVRDQLAGILGYVDRLRELDTAGVEPLAHPFPVRNAFRDDEPRPSLPVDDALANAPKRAGDTFAVPAVFGE